MVLFGGNHVASYCIDAILKEGKYRIVGIIDSLKDIGNDDLGFKIIGRQEQIKDLIHKYDIHCGIIAIGDNWSRKIVHDSIKQQVPNFTFVNVIHPSAIIGMNVQIGIGVIILAGSIINHKSIINDFCYIGTGTLLGHDCEMAKYASISTGSITGGKVKIGEFSAVTLGCTILDRLIIGENTVIGSGSLVTNDIPDNVLVYGTPAKIIKSRKLGDKFLKSG